MATIETRSFKMHKDLLYSVIKRQAGSLAKAILEGVMNAVDAGASRCDLVIKEDSVTITDNGKGFANRHEIESFFETFGQPHEGSENKIYGSFRMGRGQMFSFGENSWTTGSFRMYVNIKENGLDYLLEDDAPMEPGCKINIKLYSPVYSYEFNQLTATIAKWVKYCPIEITINGASVSVNPAYEKWDITTNNAYIRISPQTELTIYNHGIYVMTRSQSNFGVGGEIVSKKQLKVNFARNDIQDDCPVWKEIIPLLHNAAFSKEKDAQRHWNDNERQHAANAIIGGLITEEDMMDMPLFTDVRGKHLSLRKVEKLLPKYKGVITVAPLGDSIGEKIQSLGMAMVFAEDVLHRFQQTEIMNVFRNVATIYNAINIDSIRLMKPIPFSQASKNFNSDLRIVNHSELNTTQITILKTLKAGTEVFSEDKRRTLFIGEGLPCAWTNSRNYVAINKDFFTTLNVGIDFWVKMGVLLMHEYAHDHGSEGTHMHSPEFYEEFHSLCEAYLPKFVDHCFKSYPAILNAEGKKIPGKTMTAITKRIKSQIIMETADSV